MPDVTCTWIDSDHINHIVFHKATRQAVYDYINWQKDHLAVSVADGCGLTLIDIRQSGLPPVVHLQQRNNWMKAHYRIPDRSCTALLYSANMMMSLVNSAIMMIRRDADRDQLRLFTDEAAAFAWLRDCRLNPT